MCTRDCWHQEICGEPFVSTSRRGEGWEGLGGINGSKRGLTGPEVASRIWGQIVGLWRELPIQGLKIVHSGLGGGGEEEEGKKDCHFWARASG